MKKLVLGLAAMCLVPALAFAAVSNDELKLGITQEFENMNPVVMNMVASTMIYQMVGRSLDSLDANGKWVPQLAKSIPSIENGAVKLSADKKKMTVVWELRDNAKWGDGQPVTCADFEFTRQVQINDNVSSPNKESYTFIDKIEADPKNPQKCIFSYNKAQWDFYQEGDFHALPKHIEEEVYNKYKDQKEGYEKNSNYTKNPTMPGLYNGPYRISEIKLADHVTVVPNQYFYGKQPKIKKIQIKLIPNTGTLEANLRSGTIDAVASLGFTFDQALAFEKKVKSEKLPFTVLFKPSNQYEHIDLNLDNPLVQDVRVRKALVYAINREELVKALFDNRQDVAIHNIAPMDSWYTKDPKNVVLYPHDKKKAGELLDEAGWKLEGDGFRHKDGKKLTLIFMTTAGNKNRENVQVFLQNQWKAVGVDVQIKNEPARVFFGDTIRKRQFGAMAMYAWMSSPEATPRTTLHSNQIPSDKNGWSGQNNGDYNNKEMDSLLDKLDVEFNSAKRKALVAQILHRYTDDVPVIPLYYTSDKAVIPPNLTGYNLTGHQYVETNNVEDWEVKATK